MNCLVNLGIRAIVLISLVLISNPIQAAFIQHDVSISLSQSNFDTNNWYVDNIAMPATVIAVGDTIKVNLSFSDGRVRWIDTGFFTENAVFSINDPNGPSGIVLYVSDFSFSNPGGELFFNSFVSNSGSGGFGILGSTNNLGKENLTDSFFEFDGLSFLFQITSATHFPITSDSFGMSLVGGDFSIAAVPLPSAIWMFVSGLALLFGLRKNSR